MTTTNAPWMAERIERRPVSSLLPYAKNARTHSTEQVRQIAGSIRRFGFTVPVLIKGDGTIAAGHGRVLAAADLGLDEVPVVVAPAWWSDGEFRAYVLADNKIAANAGWDDAILKFELADLKALEFDLSDLGWSDIEIGKLFPTTGGGNADPEDVPEAPVVAVSQPGDVWLLGRHRLACGSCTDAETVKRALGGNTPVLMVTDPPWGTHYDPTWRATAKKADGTLLSTGNDRAVGLVLNEDRADWREAWALFPGSICYVWHAGIKTHEVALSLLAEGFELRSQLIWAKSHFAISRGHYHLQHEACWYAVRKGASARWKGDRKQSTVWNIDKPRKNVTGHSTEKPLEVMKRPIEHQTEPGDGVYEPFSGSGTTLVAAEVTGRNCFAIELHPPFVDIGVLRWQGVTGGIAVLEGTGETYAEVAARRQAEAA